MIFIDEAKIFVKGGDGGQGCESFYRDKYMRYPRPDGGDGGKGGDVIFIAAHNIQTLLDYKFKQHYKAQRGFHASSKGKTGKRGKDCILRVPIGTIIKDYNTGLIIKDLSEEMQSVVVVKGGAGGIGNDKKKIPKSPKHGEERTINLELKLIADVGIIGFPNAGKSTFINKVSKVKSKIANYPFTTKSPILGIVEGEDFNFIIADLPGIIEGAHTGRGLGDKFLRHAERTKILLHVIDMAGTECRDPLDDYEKICNELLKYSEELTFKHKIVVANKMDISDATGNLKRFKKKYKIEIIPISATKGKGIQETVSLLRNILCQENFQEKLEE